MKNPRLSRISILPEAQTEEFAVGGLGITKRDNSINTKEIRTRYYEFSGGSNVGIPGRASPSNSPRGCGYRIPEEIQPCVQPIQPTFAAAFRLCACGLYPRPCPRGSSLSPPLCRRDRTIRGFRLTCRPKHRGAPQHPSKLFKLRDMLRGPALPPAPRLSLHLSTRFRLYGSLAILPTYPTPAREIIVHVYESGRVCGCRCIFFSPFPFFFFFSKKLTTGVFRKEEKRDRGGDLFYGISRGR